MIERGLHPDFPREVLEETAELEEVRRFGGRVRDCASSPVLHRQRRHPRPRPLTFSEPRRDIRGSCHPDVDASSRRRRHDSHAGHNTSRSTPRPDLQCAARLSTGSPRFTRGDRLAVWSRCGSTRTAPCRGHVSGSGAQHARITYNAVPPGSKGTAAAPGAKDWKPVRLQDQAPSAGGCAATSAARSARTCGSSQCRERPG